MASGAESVRLDLVGGNANLEQTQANLTVEIEDELTVAV